MASHNDPIFGAKECFDTNGVAGAEIDLRLVVTLAPVRDRYG